MVLSLTLTNPLDAYEKIVSAVGMETCKTRTMANALTTCTCTINVYMMLGLYEAQSI